jgi:hypothetical protein
MSMPISGSGASLQALKAQQAWEARKAVSKTTIDSSAEAAVKVSNPKGNQAQRPAAQIEDPIGAAQADPASRLGRAIPEIQEIARRAGFVGLSAQDIQRAYARGESLLSDYRV